MGDNRGYSIYEEIVIGLYDNNALNGKTLEVILNPFKGTDMDHGGCADLKTKDGLSADEVVVKVGNPQFWQDYHRRRQAFFAWCGVKSWEEWAEKDYDTGSDEWREDSRLGDEFHDAWVALTETW